jgi:trehalose 6-phosphate phosphatase
LNTTTSLQNVLAQRPLGLAFDIDGTLSPIAPTSDAATLYPGVAELLEQAKKHARIAIMTGREIEDGAKKINVEGLTYIGTHGLEWSDGLPWLHPIHLDPEAIQYAGAGKYLLDLVDEQIDRLPGVYVQRKRVGGAILEEPAKRVSMSLSEGKRIVEIRAPLEIHKGTALREFAQRSALHALVFAGDDRTDLDAILELARLREEGLAALAIVVKHHDTLPELLANADIVVNDVPEMAALLKKMVGML